VARCTSATQHDCEAHKKSGSWSQDETDSSVANTINFPKIIRFRRNYWGISRRNSPHPFVFCEKLLGYFKC
jgi:hypothetical protein